MAEFLIIAKKHWSEDADQTNWPQWKKDKMAKQYRIGDIVEVRENGYWSSLHGWDHNSFFLLIVNSINVDDVKHLMDSYIVGDTMIFKRRYAINVASIDIQPGSSRTINAIVFNNAIGEKVI